MNQSFLFMITFAGASVAISEKLGDLLDLFGYQDLVLPNSVCHVGVIFFSVKRGCLICPIVHLFVRVLGSVSVSSFWKEDRK